MPKRKLTTVKRNLTKPNIKKPKINISSNDVLKYSQLSIIVFALLLVSLYFIHQANNKRIAIQNLKEEIGKLRAEHTALKVEEVELFKHSSLLNEVKNMDLDYSDEPLKIIYYDKQGI